MVKKKTSWTTLDQNAAANTSQITITSSTTNWKIGDEILIAPSRLDWNEGEKRTITAISSNKKTLTLNSALQYPHIGEVKSYTRSKDGKTWTSDMRAEVGLLTKSIKIQGDASSENNQYGGHIMIHSNGIAHVDYVELYRMGQKSILGRYPFHWHLIQEKGQGQYLKNASIHRTYNRAITIHGTESTLVENNFCYDHIGHGIFLEDGSERYNIIRGNVVLLTKRPAAGEELTPSDNEMNEVQNRTPASFWITNPNNTFENNIAAGTQGTGFWFAMPQKPMGPSASISRFANIEPYKEPLGKFEGNKAHSCKSGFDIFDQLTASHSIIRNGSWQRTDTRVMNKCTWYANELAVYGGIGGGRTYTEDVIFRNNIFADNKVAIMHANYSTTEESVFIANSGENVFNGERALNRGYDGSCSIHNCHLVDWDASNANYVMNTGGSNKHVNYRVSGITKDFQGAPRMSFPDYSKPPKGEVGANANAHPRFWSYIHWDMDGSLAGKPNTSIITNHPLCRDGSEVRYENWTNLYRTDRRFAYYTMTFPNKQEIKSTVVRTKPGTPKVGMYYINAGFYGPNTQFPVIVNDDFLYTIQFETLSSTKNFTIRMQDDYVAGDEVLVRFKDLGKIVGIGVTGKPKLNSLAELKASKVSAYTIDGGYLYLKMVSIASNPDISFNVAWTGSYNLPILDTDGDGKSDYEESVVGTDPIPNDPIPTNPVLKVNPEVVVQSTILNVNDTLTVTEGYKLVLEANATTTGTGIEKVSLSIDNTLIREERSAPYEWGHATSPNPNELNGLPIGMYQIKVVAKDISGIIATDMVILVVKEAKEPYLGIPMVIPGVIEAEHFDKGGEGISYHDVDSQNKGAVQSAFRILDGVDIGVGNGGYTLGWTSTNEWLEYTVNIKKATSYDFEFHTSSLNGGGVLKLDLDGNSLLSGIEVPKTDDWYVYQSITETVNLPIGNHVLRINIEKNGFNLDKVIVKEAMITSNKSTISTALTIYPNPSKNGLFKLSKSSIWELYTLQGVKLQEGDGFEIDISNQRKGIYILKSENLIFQLIVQ